MMKNNIFVEAGDKIRFLVKHRGLFIGYVNKLTNSSVSLKGCKLIEPLENLQDVAKLSIHDTRTFSNDDISSVEILQITPF